MHNKEKGYSFTKELLGKLTCITLYNNNIVQYLRTYGKAKKADIRALLWDKLPEILDNSQKEAIIQEVMKLRIYILWKLFLRMEKIMASSVIGTIQEGYPIVEMSHLLMWIIRNL